MRHNGLARIIADWRLAYYCKADGLSNITQDTSYTATNKGGGDYSNNFQFTGLTVNGIYLVCTAENEPYNSKIGIQSITNGTILAKTGAGANYTQSHYPSAAIFKANSTTVTIVCGGGNGGTSCRMIKLTN
mgnify:CR=1 FL=1